tara:strand:+ start:809 stop:1972 length:1164 start_codon:yes stop_codon:yes gene_type:complete
MFLIDQYKNLINNSESNEEILNNIYNSTNDKLLKLEKIKKKKTLKKKIDILKKDKVNISHMIFYGKKGNSKEIIVNKLLEKIYGKNDIKLDLVEYEINGYGNVKTRVNIKQSKYHIVIEPNNNGFDKYLIQEVVKRYSNTEVLNITRKSKPFKFVVINKIDKLSEYAQASLRRTIELVSDKCKFIFICDQLSRIIEPLRSRCILFRIPLLTDKMIFKVLLEISIAEKINITSKQISNIINTSDNMITTAIWNLELFKNNYNYDYNWKNLIKELVNEIFKITTQTDNKFNNNLLKFIKFSRITFYLLFTTNIEITDIFRKLMIQLLNKCQDINIKLRILDITSIFEKRISTGTRYIIHFEAYLMRILYLLFKSKHGKDYHYSLDCLEM